MGFAAYIALQNGSARILVSSPRNWKAEGMDLSISACAVKDPEGFDVIELIGEIDVASSAALRSASMTCTGTVRTGSS